MTKERKDELALTFASAILNCFQEPEARTPMEDFPVVELEGDWTEELYELIRGLYAVYLQISGDKDTDIVDFTHIINKVVFLLGRVEDEDE